MSEKKDVKNIKEVLRAALRLTFYIQERGKDGYDLKDVGALIMKFASEEDFRDLFIEAGKGIDQVFAEGKDIDISEVIDILLLIKEEFANRK